ncbi:pro-resilin [Plutella xylostella]|uniref:pro-resilin n=1 Tax=Plutella xylostella TaxID=51655 RepID=UPI00203306C0|nr:pro-resilin [Plutella xylostella]
MKIVLACTMLLAVAIAEPPVDNRYLPPQQGGYRTTNQDSFAPPAQTYGAPAPGVQRQTDAVFRSQNRPSSSYGTPAQARRPSNQYGPPARQSQSCNLINHNHLSIFSRPSAQYGAPSRQQNAPSNQYNAPSSQYNAPSNQYNAPSSQYNAPSSQYNAPSSQYNAPSSQYNAPSSQYSAPSSQYNAPEPSQQYGAPSQQYSAPSQQYGPPGSGSGRLGSGSGQAQSRQYLLPNARSNGYDGSDGEGNGEPANYSFDYKVQDDESGNDFGHRESRMGDRTEGLYYVLLPDGRKQTVEYEADQDGYRPKISYEDTGRGQGGYDSNSQDLSASGYQGGSGPY